MKYLLTSETMHAVFFTLLHSLWQGLLLALAGGMQLLFTKRSAPAIRYNLFCVLLLTFAACNLITLYYEINVAGQPGAFSAGKIIASVTGTITWGVSTEKQSLHFPGSFVQFITPYEQILIAAWFFVTLLKCVYLLAGIRQMHFLKYRQTFDAGDYWNQRIKDFAARIGVKKKVVLLRSTLAKIPMAAGHFKPVILFPASLLTTLPPEETEAILLHELAHIRRKDYLVNMLQNITEIIFFFNPAVLWISSKMKEERENCCDDIAITVMQDKKQFLHALVSFQEYNIRASRYAASFPGSKHQLLHRVKRIITNNNKTLTNMEKIFLVSGLAITGFLMVSFSQHKPVSPAQATIIAAPATDTIPAKQPTTNRAVINSTESKNTINATLDGKKYRIVETNGKITELYVNDKKVPATKIGGYTAEINTIRLHAKGQMHKQFAKMKLQQEAFEKKQIELMKQKELLVQQAVNNNEKLKLLEEESIADADILKNKQLLDKELQQKNELLQLEDKALLEKHIELLKQKELLIEQHKKTEQTPLLKKELLSKEGLMMKKELQKEKLLKMNEQILLKNKELLNQADQLKMQPLQKDKTRDSIQQVKPVAPQNPGPGRSGLVTKDILTDI